jgi:flavin-dependent dehydrogenase
MNKHINSITVLGGGTAGLVSALILKKSFPEINVTVIRSSDIGIIGVGEGSTEHWSEFMQFMNINARTLIQETDATFKSGIMFKNWGGEDYLQSIGNGFNITHNGYPYMYGHQISQNKSPKELASPLAWHSRANVWFLGQESTQVQQYHFNTNKLNTFLENLSNDYNINIIDDEIINVNSNENGIVSLEGKQQLYESDFFIDCTGFRRVLMNELGCEWESYSKYLKMKSAIVFPIEFEKDEEIPLWTLAQGMDAGWMFRLPVWGRYGNGYIFDSDFITADEAHAEVNKYFGREIEISKHINFDPGALKDTWIKNCVAIGLSASFVEPLEASSIGTSIQQAFLLTEHLINYNDTSIKDYNADCNDILTNIRDFVILHYLGNRTDTDFWKAVSETELPDSLTSNLSKWKNTLPSEKDFSKVTDKILFSHFHYILIMHGLGLFDINNIAHEYKMRVPYDKQLEAERTITENSNAPYTTIPHKTMLEVLRTMRTWPNF